MALRALLLRRAVAAAAPPRPHLAPCFGTAPPRLRLLTRCCLGTGADGAAAGLGAAGSPRPHLAPASVPRLLAPTSSPPSTCVPARTVQPPGLLASCFGTALSRPHLVAPFYLRTGADGAAAGLGAAGPPRPHLAPCFGTAPSRLHLIAPLYFRTGADGAAAGLGAAGPPRRCCLGTGAGAGQVEDIPKLIASFREDLRAMERAMNARLLWVPAFVIVFILFILTSVAAAFYQIGLKKQPTGEKIVTWLRSILTEQQMYDLADHIDPFTRDISSRATQYAWREFLKILSFGLYGREKIQSHASGSGEDKMPADEELPDGGDGGHGDAVMTGFLVWIFFVMTVM